MPSHAIHIELKNLDLIQDPKGTPSLAPSRAHACAKVILVGEHAVVYGAQAVALPVTNMKLEIVLEAVQNKKLSRRHTSLKTSHSENLQLVLREALELLKIDPFPLRIKGSSKIPFGAGLGASAALSVCILRALSQFFSKKIDDLELASLANQLEKRFHGKPSGLDATTVALEKPLLFARNQDLKIIEVKSLSSNGKKLPWCFAIIDSDTRSPTLTMVQQSAPYFQDKAGEERVRLFNALAEQMTEALEGGNLTAVQDAMQKANRLLHEIGVVPPLLQNIIQTAQECGALSAKITGAGGGGCILCLLDPLRVDETLSRLREEFGASKVHELFLIGS